MWTCGRRFCRALTNKFKPSIFQGNRRISRIALRANAASELEQPRQRQRKKKKRENKKKQRGLWWTTIGLPSTSKEIVF